jgi:hypothetical protein
MDDLWYKVQELQPELTTVNRGDPGEYQYRMETNTPPVELEALTRADMLLYILRPCMRKSRNENWSEPRYKTNWGSKDTYDMIQLIVKIMYGKRMEENT